MSDTTNSRQPQPQAGGLLGGEQNQGAERLVSPGGALGGSTEPQSGGNQSGTAGDASASTGTDGAPAEAGKGASGQPQEGAREEASQDTRKAETEESGKHSGGKAPAGSGTSEDVKRILDEAERKVRENGDTDHPETEEKNRKIIKAREEAEKAAKSGEHEGHAKGAFADKFKGIIHHNKS